MVARGERSILALVQVGDRVWAPSAAREDVRAVFTNNDRIDGVGGCLHHGCGTICGGCGICNCCECGRRWECALGDGSGGGCVGGEGAVVVGSGADDEADVVAV